jgi:cytosine/adenosine deaminase-related metal-dependent hydrolase
METEQLSSGAKRGLLNCWRFGVTTVADTGDSGAAAAALTELGGSGVVYQEVFGPHPDQAPDAIGALRDRFQEMEGVAGPRVRIGVSPHAPYSVSAALYSEVAGFAQNKIPVAMHLAESEAESQLVREMAGPFADMWRARGIPAIPAKESPVQYVQETGILDCAPLIIHAVRVNSADAQRLADAGCSIAACPISNRAHGHGDPPVELWVQAGIPVGLGTDSVASVGDLDLFREAAAFRGLSGESGSESLFRLTKGGAEVLSLENELGSLQSGFWGDLCCIETGPDVTDPEEAVVTRGSQCILRTYVGGRCVYSREPQGTENV